MTQSSDHAIAQILLQDYGRTFAEELNIHIENNTPSDLFRLLYTSLLCSARIRGATALAAVKALAAQGWTTPEKMVASTWKERVKVLDEAGYTRYDESTATPHSYLNPKTKS
jgi:hypothetical protein